MASQSDNDEPLSAPRRRPMGCWALLASLLLLLVVGLAIVWASREKLADDLIADELDKRGVQATYKIERIGGRRQILRDIVVGDPARPDLTVERAEVTIRYRFGYPRIASVRLVRPRLFATYIDGKLSFGELDPLIFTGEERPFEFPDFALSVVDGRGLLEGDYGPIGFKVEGDGHLQGGFAGTIAAVAPRLAVPGCEPARSTLYGKMTIEAERPRFEGPLRVSGLSCPDQGLSIRNAAVQVDAKADKLLQVFDGEAGLDVRETAFGDTRLAALGGATRFTWRDGGLTARYDLDGTGLATPQLAASNLSLDGSLRTRRNFERIEVDTEVDGRGIRLGGGFDRALADAASASSDTLLGPILAQVRSRLASEGRNSRLVADVTMRRTGERMSIVVPEAALRGGSGATLLSLSRFQLATGGPAAARFAGNFSTGGAGLPRLEGRMEQRPGGEVQVRLSMAEYRAGPSRLAIPELVLVQRPNGALGFAGTVRASGALPGGSAQDLLLPVSGNWSSAGGLALWDKCTDLRFERLQLANLTLARQRLQLCPARGAPIVRYGAGGLRIAAGAPSLQLAGHLGETPIAIRSGAIGFAYPGAISAKSLLVSLGPAGTASTFAISDLSAQVGNDIAGKFSGTDIKLFAVQIDMIGASGSWRYANGRLSVSDAVFRLVDRTNPARFNPLAAEGASMALEDNRITASAQLRHEQTRRDVAVMTVTHNLATGRGDAALAVDGITFDEGFQPDALFPAAYGALANVRGTVTGTGRLAWDEDGKITSTGRFSSDSLDFAAAFGPVKGASGTVEFIDLLGLTTAPNQRLRVASINPGIEITEGEIVFQLRSGGVFALEGGTWPFMGGTLTMRPLEVRFGQSEVRRFVLEIEGLEASRFIERMELNNISATGVFDGTVPIVFDTEGNGRVEGGLLLSRPPGGNVSYVGELTYEDMGAIANFAFDTLRSLDYRQMSIAMDGSLTGEIVTRVRLDGVSQGVGAEQNILTDAIADLPIRLDINVRAPFYSLISTTRSLYDEAAIKDPRSDEVGLLDAQGNRIQRENRNPAPPPVQPGDLIPNEPPIQRRESEEVP